MVDATATDRRTSFDPHLYTLSIETATLNGSLSLYEGEKELFTKRWAYEGCHSDELTKFMDLVVNEAGISFADLGLIAVDWGPGSFTGIRVGVNAARTLGYLFHLPMIGLNSLEVMAHSVKEHDRSVVCLMDAQRNAFYGTSYRWHLDQWKEIQKPRLWSGSEAVEISGPRARIRIADRAIYEMDLADQLLQGGHEIVGPNPPDSKALAELAIQLYREGCFLAWDKVQPLYIRSSTAEERAGI